MRTFVAWLVAVLALAGCVSLPVEQRSTQGPTAEQVWTTRVMMQNRREPNFEERTHWQDQMERRISAFLRDHPEVANAYDVAAFRFSRQVTVGMSKEQVTVLLGAPDAMVTDAAQMEKLARGYWPHIKGRATEVWLYPGGWRLFIGEGRVTDITQYVPPGFRLG